MLLALVGFGGIAGTLVSQLTPRSFEATTRVSVTTTSAAHDQRTADGFEQQVVDSYAAVATTPLVLRRVISRLGLRTTTTELARSISAEAETGTVLIDITVADASAARAARIANEVGTELVGAARSVSPSGDPVRLTRLDTARIPLASTSNVLPFLAIGAAAGLAAALLILLLRSGRPKPPTGAGRLRWPSGWPGRTA
jgi:succinoglycan biosynthesis transport protein ExoP